jgi:SAM-dependent methyltransferase/uncharacterized protein YbaR (Trm112 family)
MRVGWRDVFEQLVDPVDHTSLEVSAEGTALVSASGRSYPIVDGQPILLPEHGLESGGWCFEPIRLADEFRPRPQGRARSAVRGFKRVLRRGAGSQGAGHRLAQLVAQSRSVERPRVLVVGGASVGEGSRRLVDHPDLDVVSFDIYPTADTTFVADGHRIPLDDDSVAAVWIQAVLEHVYRPEVVVAEIARVLGPGGLVYAETPFLQPVHEGAYDYARFSLSGHRLLFPWFDEIESGPLGGPAAMLNLALRGVVGGLTRSTTLARVAYLATQPIVLIDRVIPAAWRVDYASGSYFLGRLDDASGRGFDPRAVYRGAG